MPDQTVYATPNPHADRDLYLLRCRDSFMFLISDAITEAQRAMVKFPQPNYVISKFAEESGEVVKAAIHCAEGRETADNVRGGNAAGHSHALQALGRGGRSSRIGRHAPAVGKHQCLTASPCPAPKAGASPRARLSWPARRSGATRSRSHNWLNSGGAGKTRPDLSSSALTTGCVATASTGWAQKAMQPPIPSYPVSTNFAATPCAAGASRDNLATRTCCCGWQTRRR